MWLPWFLFFWAAFVVLTDALPNKPYLLYSNLTDVGAIDLRTHVRTDVIDGLHRVIPLDVDSVDNKLYYGDYVHGNISRSDMDGSNRELIVSDVGLIEGVAVDWVGRSIYWTSYTSEKIMVATLDGKHRKILVNTGLEYPRGLAVDPSAGYLFWTDWGYEAAVERSTLSGGNRVVLVNTNITWPNGITLDYTNKRVYWIDAFHDTITSIDYNGGQRTTIFEDVFLDASKYHGFDLDIIGNIIYWSDWRANAIIALNITTPVSKIIANISIPTFRFSHGVMGVVIVDLSRQPQGTNPCGSNNGGCQHLCLLEPNAGFKCECEIGTKPDQDEKSCIDAFKDEFLMFADADAAKIYQLQTDEINVEPVPIKFIANLSRPVALEFDPVEDRVYWTDVTRKIICRAFRNGSGYEEIVTENVGVADGLTVDLAGRNLYWTSTTHNTIEVSRFNGSLRRELINTHLDEPRDIIVDPIGGYMYWTDWGTWAKIERAFMDGNNRTELVNTGVHWPNGLTIDHVYDKLYWADAWEESIEILELKTGRRNVIINEKYFFWGYLFGLTTEVSHPYGLTLLHDYIYWTDWYSDSVYRAEINTGAEITPLANKLGKPMDIHAYNVNPKMQYRKIYTFSFPNTGSNFTCIKNRTCPPIDAAPPCPSGYQTSRVNQTCGLYCRNIVGYTWRCPCRNWQECAVRERYFIGCASGYYASYNVRECVQVVKSGRCPYKHKGSLKACINDEACSGTEKCCDSKCTEPASIATHPCQKNNGGCKPGQLCFAVPGGRRCDCGNNLIYNETKQQCEGCPPPQRPANGLLSGKCASTSEIIPYHSPCLVICNKGYKIEEGSHALFTCVPRVYWGSVPKCVVPPDPVFSHCPHNITNGTDPGLATQVVTWNVPTALDHEKKRTTVTVKPSHFVPPMKLGIDVFNIEYRTQDKDLRTSICRFSITIKDLEPPTFGSTCPQNIIKYVDSKDDGTVTWTEPTATDNVGVDTVDKNNVMSKYPVGVTSVSYIARDAAGLTATCSFIVAIINICGNAPCGFGATCVLKNVDSYKCVCGSACPTDYNPVCGSDGKDYTNQCYMRLASCNAQKNITVAKKGNCGTNICSSAPCGFGATCVLENGNKGYKCVCGSACTKENNPVCGSDGKNYTNQCYLRLASCDAQKNITVVKKGNCGCSDLRRNAADKDSNTVDCTLVNNTFACKVKCKTGYEAPFLGFLNLVCENKKWIRGNNAGKHVPVNKSPPTCYKKESASNSQCSSGFELMFPDFCIPCPPGSYSQNGRCQVCKSGEYQDDKAQTSCKPCEYPKTSLTTGAESCYFNHGSNGVYMVFKANKSQEYTQDDLRTDLANALTDYCSANKCSFEDNKTRRKRRATGQYKFDKEDIIIVSEQTDVNGRKVEFFILDPTSNERVPTKAFSSENLKTLLLKLLETQKLPSIEVESVIVAEHQPSAGGRSSDSKPNSGLIAGVTLGVLCLIAFAIGIFVFTRRLKQKNRLASSQVPPVQFSQESGGRVMQIGAPAAPPAHNYENPEAIENGVQHGFVNQVYSEVNQPPPYYATTPIRSLATGATALPDQPHVYETPAGAQGEALPAKKPLPGDGVVDLIPPKQVDLSEEKYLKADLPVKYSQNRSQGNVYSLSRGEGPHYENAGADGSLKLEPPPKYDDAKLRIIRGQTASSILPNVPRKDTNDNERETTGGRDTVHDLRDVTKEQSES